MKIIILEDHPAISFLLSSIISKIPVKTEIENFTQLGTALQAICSNPPDFVITDIQIEEYKQLEILMKCHKQKIPFMVYSSFINPTILNQCDQYKASVVVSKSASLEDLNTGIQHLIQNKHFRCKVCSSYAESEDNKSRKIPKVVFTSAEESVILAQIAGKTTIQLSVETNKSKYTIRNQRMKLMEKNGCSMEEIARRYLFWHTKG
jgi:DNA-binding NarL/FixJ family response regulator